MIYYIAVFLLLLLPLILDEGKFKQRNNFIYYLIVPLFLCFGYMTGSDWRGYELNFDYDNLTDIIFYSKEKGYGLLGYLFKIIGLSFWHYSITIKLVGYYIFLSFYRKYSECNVFGLVFFFVNTALFLWIDHPARNFCAIIIYLFSFKYIYEKKFVKYLLICLLASFFHLTALFLIPIYFFYRYYSNKSLIVFIVLSILLLFIQQILFGFIEDYLMRIEFIANRLDSYIYSEKGYMKIASSFMGLSLNTIIIIIMLKNRNKIETKFKYGYFMIFTSIVFFFFLIIGLAFPILFRLNLFFAIPYTIMLSLMFVSSTKLYKIILILFCIVSPFYILIRDITSDYRYIPYTNYLEYIFKDKPYYYYRNTYNFLNSPYNKEKRI